jgi:hypothetical protein
MQSLFRAALLALVACLPACASIVSGTDSTTYLETKPVDARCRMHGQDFTREVVTPTSVPLPAKASPITVECNAEGYQRTIQQIEASHDGWVFGNLIFGGIVGGVVDIARGAGKKFPPQMQVLLDPATFRSAAERDSHFDSRAKAENEIWDKAVGIVRTQCDPSQVAECQRKVEEVEVKRRASVGIIEANRSASRIIGG